MMGKSGAFIVPICVDATREADADVPDSFLAVQWTRLPGGETPPAFCGRVKKLLGGELGAQAAALAPFSNADGTRPSPDATDGKVSALPGKRPRRPWIAVAVGGLAAALALVLWQPWRKPGAAPLSSTPKAAAMSKTANEVAQLRARLIPHAWKKEDFEPWSAAIDRIIAADDQNADAWALRSIINSLPVMRNFEVSTKLLETGRAAANRALHLAPTSPLAELALGMHLAAMINRGDDPQAARPHLRRAFAGLPRDPLVWYADLTTAWLGYDFEEVERTAKAWLESDPGTKFPAFLLAQMHLAIREPVEAEKWATQAASDEDITGMRSYGVIFDAHYYVRGDLLTGRTTLDRIPIGARSAHKVIHARWLLSMAERRWDAALQELARTPESVLFEGAYYGPKAFLAGMAHQAAGRTEAALAQFREAERVLRELLANDAQNEPLHAVLAITLACAGRAADARGELTLVEPLVRGRPRTVYSGRVMVMLAHAHGMLEETEATIFWLRELLSGPSNMPFTPASLRIDPRFQGVITRPEMQALLTEFAHLDAAKSKAAAISAPDQ